MAIATVNPATGEVVKTFENLKAILEQAGSGLEKVLSVTSYLKDYRLWPQYNEIYKRYFTTPPRPARTTVGADLFPPYRFEITAIAYVDERFQIASLDHSVWFHRPCRLDQWVLFVIESPSFRGGRAFTRGRFFTQDGRLVASAAQEGVIRVRG